MTHFFVKFYEQSFCKWSQRINNNWCTSLHRRFSNLDRLNACLSTTSWITRTCFSIFSYKQGKKYDIVNMRIRHRSVNWKNKKLSMTHAKTTFKNKLNLSFIDRPELFTLVGLVKSLMTHLKEVVNSKWLCKKWNIWNTVFL